jgi:DnaJ family protein C protein 17
MRASLLKRKKMQEMTSERRRFVEELERAERESKRPRDDSTAGGLSAAERNKLMEAGRRRMQERERLMKEAEERAKLRSNAGETQAAEPSASAKISEADHAAADEASAPTTTTDTDAEAKGDEYDARIAELERRLKEKQERKAARKAGDKKPRKSDVAPSSSAQWPPLATESTADETKASDTPIARAFAFNKPYAASAPSSPATTKFGIGGDGSSSSSFATTFAKLKAAQAKRDAEKKKREEAAATQEGAIA